jgi:putative ABC transport system permease protein
MDYIIKIKKPRKNLFNDPWVWQMAFRDARNNFSRLFLFISSIIIGIAALVAIESFNTNLQADINNQAKDLLGADLTISSSKEFEESTIAIFDSLEYEQAMDVRFASMVLFLTPQGGTRLVQVVASEGNYPFYGTVEALPEGVMTTLKTGRNIVIDESLAMQYEVSSGDSLKLGDLVFEVQGIIRSMPGTNAVAATFAPSVYISLEYLEETGLIQFGSRYSYKKYFKTATIEEADLLLEDLRPEIRRHGYSFDTVEEEKEDLGEAFQNLYRFFNLLGFVALILGCIGVASSIHIYVQQKKTMVAVLRCMGASAWQSFNIFFIQSVILGVLGSVFGVLLGIGIQQLVPILFGGLIPVEITLDIVWIAVGKGLGLGLIISGIFSFLPLSNIRRVTPLMVLRSDYNGSRGFSKMKTFVIILAILFPWLFAIDQTGSLINGSAFMAALIGSFLVLTGVAKLIIFLVKKFFPSNWGFIWRQSLSNLFRPQNQTTVLVVVIGLGAFLVSTLLLIQNSLLNQVEFMGSEERPNTVLFDIQPTQKDGVVELVEEYNLPIQQLVPIVTTRLSSVKGIPVSELQKDTTDNIPNWALRREYRVTYRDKLIDSETLVDGEILPEVRQPGDTIWVSISESMAENLDAEIGTEIVFDVQGVPITTYIGSMREVDWQRIQTNFIFVFPLGVLEPAPQFYVLMTRSESQSNSAAFQQELVRKFPNVSAIDLKLILQTIDEFMGKVAYVIQFMALFSIVTGLIVLAGAVINSKYVRLRENVLLRTIGALKNQIVGMTLLEYGYLGILAGLTGILLAIISGWGLTLLFFDVNFVPDFKGLFIVWFSVAVLTMTVGWLNTRSIINNSPLEVLRKEV